MVRLERVSGGKRGIGSLAAGVWCNTSIRFIGGFDGEPEPEEVAGTMIFSAVPEWNTSRFLELEGFFEDGLDPEVSQLVKSDELAFLFDAMTGVELLWLYVAVMRSADACTSPSHWTSASSTTVVSG